jgi:hypothetical protein
MQNSMVEQICVAVVAQRVVGKSWRSCSEIPKSISVIDYIHSDHLSLDTIVFLPTKILKGRKVKAAEYETDHSRKILTKLLNSDYSKEKS